MPSDHSILQSLQAALAGQARGGSTEARLTFFLLLDALWKFFDDIGGSTISELPAILRDELRIANRMCRFVLADGVTVIGTGFLVGPSHVMTAAHVFFEPDGAGTGRLIDPHRPTDISVEFLTIYAGTSLVSVGPPTAFSLDRDWAVDPVISGSATDREVEDLDFAIVKLQKPVGNDTVGGGGTRQWFQIPPSASVPTVAANSMVRVFQYLDRGSLRTSSGVVKGVNDARTRVLYSASTRDAASGSAVVNDQLQLIGVHVSGADEKNPFANQGLPLLRIAKYLDAKDIRTSVSPNVPT